MPFNLVYVKLAPNTHGHYEKLYSMVGEAFHASTGWYFCLYCYAKPGHDTGGRAGGRSAMGPAYS